MELKCVDTLNLEHLLQVIIYYWMWKEVSNKGKRKFKILNMRNGEIKELDTSSHYIEEIIKILLENKFGKITQENDNAFINNIDIISKEINSKARVIPSSSTIVTNFLEDSDDEPSLKKLPPLPSSSSSDEEDIITTNKKKFI